MTPEPSNEYQELVEALEQARREMIEEGHAGWPNLIEQALSALAVSETAGRVQLKLPHADDAADPSSSEVAAQPQPALPHAGDDGWQDIAELKPKFGEVLGWADGCGYEVVRCHSDGHRYAGAFTADWVTHFRPLPTPPVGVSDNG